MSFHLATNRDDVILPGLAPELPHSNAFTAAEAAQNSKIAQLKAAQVAVRRAPHVRAELQIPEDGSSLTTHTGAGVDNTTEWLKAGARGPSDLSDLHGREKVRRRTLDLRDAPRSTTLTVRWRWSGLLTRSDERIPERVLHARGTGAHGTFKLHTSLADVRVLLDRADLTTQVTCAKIFTEVGKETPLFVRFSTVLCACGPLVSADSLQGLARQRRHCPRHARLRDQDVQYVRRCLAGPDVCS